MTALITSATAFAEQQTLRDRADAPTRRADSSTERADAPATSKTDAAHPDAELAAWLIIDNEGEVAVAQFARQQASDPQVKEFAERMVNEHQQLIEKLRQVAGRERRIARGATEPGQTAPRRETGERRRDVDRARGDADVDVRIGDRESARPRVSVQGEIPGIARHSQMGRLDCIALKRQISEKCQQSVKSELERKEGREFDMCFLGHQMMAHMLLADTLEVFQNHASAELKPILAEAHKSVQGHLEHAKELAKSVDRDSSETVRRNEAGERVE
jgi:predicted outer membrane protein